MAKKSKSNKYSQSRGRVLLPNARHLPVLPRGLITPLNHAKLLADLRLVEDRRTFSPQKIRPRLNTRGRPASTTLKPERNPRRANRLLHQLSFALPAETIVCVRRTRRKQVLFATNKSGRNGGRKYRRNDSSAISCKRR